MTIQPKDLLIDFDTTLLAGDLLFNEVSQDLETESGIRTAVIISLFTDRRANNDDVLPDPNSTDKRGWWGDLASPDVEGDRIGSRLWLLSREKTVETTVPKTKGYITESLEWMLDDNDKIAKKIDVEVERQGTPGNDILAFSVAVHMPGDSIYTYDFEV